MVLKKIRQLPLGYSEVVYKQMKYGVSRADFNNGNSIKIYAEALGARDIISLNYYITKKGERLKPCEMPKEKVLRFLNDYQLL